uniref:hypothetical protein n=1 Tax=Vibrio splendidus TaxID=29497 RepID=UPI0010568B47
MTEKENLTLVCIQFYLNIVGNNENNNPDNTKLDEANKLDKDNSLIDNIKIIQHKNGVKISTKYS